MPPARGKKVAPSRPRPRRAYLAAHNLEKTYGGRRVVNGVSLYVRRGEAVGLLGPNGAGKTTAFYMITGLIKAERGKIELDGHDVTHLPMYQRARLGIGYLPPEASIFPGLHVGDKRRVVSRRGEPDPPPAGGGSRALRRGFRAAPPPQDALDRAFGRRAPPRRDRPRARE